MIIVAQKVKCPWWNGVACFLCNPACTLFSRSRYSQIWRSPKLFLRFKNMFRNRFLCFRNLVRSAWEKYFFRELDSHVLTKLPSFPKVLEIKLAHSCSDRKPTSRNASRDRIWTFSIHFVNPNWKYRGTFTANLGKINEFLKINWGWYLIQRISIFLENLWSLCFHMLFSGTFRTVLMSNSGSVHTSLYHWISTICQNRRNWLWTEQNWLEQFPFLTEHSQMEGEHDKSTMDLCCLFLDLPRVFRSSTVFVDKMRYECRHFTRSSVFIPLSPRIGRNIVGNGNCIFTGTHYAPPLQKKEPELTFQPEGSVSTISCDAQQPCS